MLRDQVGVQCGTKITHVHPSCRARREPGSDLRHFLFPLLFFIVYMIPADRSVPRTPTILKTFGNHGAPAPFIPHVLAAPKVMSFHAGMTDMTFGALVS